MPPRPARLKVNDDGTLELPLASRVGNDGQRTARPPIHLPEPSMIELARIRDLAVIADKELVDLTEELPEVPPEVQAKIGTDGTLLEDATADERAILTKRAAVFGERTRVAFSEDSPHGKAMIAVVELLTGQLIEPADLPGWAMHWTVLGEVLTRFMDPFAGRAAELVDEARANAGMTTGSGS